MRRDEVQGKVNANRTHFEVGAKVRKTIEELGGTMPEDLPTPDTSVKKLERERQKKLKGKTGKEFEPRMNTNKHEWGKNLNHE